MISAKDYAFLSDFLYKESGLSLGANKQYLVERRLLPIVNKKGFSSIAELVDQIRYGNDFDLLFDVREAMMVPEVFFFHDMLPFEILREFILPGMIEAGGDRRQLRIWSAGCATGQEVYSIAMVLAMFPSEFEEWDIKILGTDISRTTLDQARQGIFSDFEIKRGISSRMREEFFVKVKDGWQITEKIRKQTEFKELNLTQPFSFSQNFDIVFCRNILIYFDPEKKREILSRMHRILANGGFLMLGSTELIPEEVDTFEQIEEFKTGTYRRV